MNQILEKSLIDEYNQNGAVLVKGKFDHYWINKLKEGFKKAKSNPSPRFVNHTKDKSSPSYYEDFWTWNLIPEFDFINFIISKKSFLTVGSPPVNLILQTPSSDKAFDNLPISSALRKVRLSLLSIWYPFGKQYPHLKLQTSVIDNLM